LLGPGGRGSGLCDSHSEPRWEFGVGGLGLALYLIAENKRTEARKLSKTHSLRSLSRL